MFWNPLEKPWLLTVIAIVVFAVLHIVRDFKPAKIGKWYLLVPIIIIALAFGLDYLIETDREKIFTIIDVAETAIVNEKIEPLEQIVAVDYSDSRHSDRQQAFEHCKVLYLIAPLSSINHTYMELNVDQAKAVAEIEAFISFDPESQAGAMVSKVMVKLRVTFAKDPAAWKIISSELLEVNRKPLNWGQIQ